MATTKTTATTSPWTQFVTSVDNGFKAFETKAVAIAKDIGVIVENALVATFDEVMLVAFPAVAAEAPKVISGEEKFGNAVTNVIQTIEAKGKVIALQNAQMAVQAAYLKLKQDLAA